MRGIYKIVSKIKPERFYIGSAILFSRRVYEHKKLLRADRHHSKTMQRHVNKYGVDDLVFEIIESVETEIDLIPREQYYLDLFNPYFNSLRVAGSVLGFRHSDESKAKMSANAKRLMQDPARRENVRIKSLGNKNCLGKKRSPESIRKTAEARIGVPRSEETKRKISAFNKGKKISEVHKKQISEARINFFKENPKSIAILEMLKDNNRKKSKPVIAIRDSVEIVYPSINEAARQTDCDVANIGRVIRGFYKQTKGYVFKEAV